MAKKKAASKKAPAKSSGAKRTVPQHRLYAAHAGHNGHLCELTAKRQMNKVAILAKDAKFVCHICGRGAAKPSSLCEAVEI